MQKLPFVTVLLLIVLYGLVLLSLGIAKLVFY